MIDFQMHHNYDDHDIEFLISAEFLEAAKAKVPCVVFIDEIDSIGAKRTNATLHPGTNQTVNPLLSEMDGYVISAKFKGC